MKNGSSPPIDEDHTGFSLETGRWGRLALETPLVGRHQALNAALAVRIAEALPDSLRPDASAVREGVHSVTWPGRTQVEHLGATTWLFDVAHNPAGVDSLVAVLDRLPLPGPRVLVLGVLGDKEWSRMLPPLFERADAVVLTQPPSAPEERRWDPVRAARAVSEGRGPEPEIEPLFEAALERARALAGEGTIVVTGSNHTVGDALSALGLDPA